MLANSLLVLTAALGLAGIVWLLFRNRPPYPFDDLRQEVASAFGGSMTIRKSADYPWGGGFPAVQFEKAGVAVIFFVHEFNGYDRMRDCGAEVVGGFAPEGQRPAVRRLPPSEVEIRTPPAGGLAICIWPRSQAADVREKGEPDEPDELSDSPRFKAEIGGHVATADDPRQAESAAQCSANTLGSVFQTGDPRFDSRVQCMSAHPDRALRLLQRDDIREAVWRLVWDNAPYGAFLEFTPDKVRWNTTLTDNITREQIGEIADRLLWLRQEIGK